MAIIANTAQSVSETYSIMPHGGKPIHRLATGAEARDLLANAASLPKIFLDARTASDAELIATGALAPLDGFVRKSDYYSVIQEMRLGSGEVFPIPIVLTVPHADRGKIREGETAALVVRKQEGEKWIEQIVGTIAVDELYSLDRSLEAREVYRTEDPQHPGVAYLQAAARQAGGELGVGGTITLGRRTIDRFFPEHHRDPAELRALFQERNWRTIVGFQTRNPIHRAHEYLLRVALEGVDGLVVHPLVGETKSDDVPASVRMKCYAALLDKYFPKERALLSVFPFAMRYAGPREAILHAIARQNYGFTHFIVGRDHAGVGNYYGTYDAQRIFDRLRPGDLKINTLFFEHSFYCKSCQGVASIKTCPHDAAERLALSGTRVRELLTLGHGLPAEYSRPEVAAILTEAYRARAAEQSAAQA